MFGPADRPKHTYFCEPCRARNGWPGLRCSAYGPCDCCGGRDVLYSVAVVDLKPFVPRQTDLEAAQMLRNRVETMRAAEPRAQFVVNVFNLRLACWLREQVADLLDVVDIRCQPDGLYVL